MKTSDREKQEFRNVALHLDTHSQIKEIADAEQRTITRQLKIIIQQKHEDMLMCLQSNNYYEINSHINCHDSLEHFIDSLPLKNIIYSGTKNHKDEYDRFMVIGK